MQRSRVYLDAGGAAPLTPRVRDALRAGFVDAWADPARMGAESRHAGAILSGAREAMAEALGTRQERVFFTASPHLAFERLVAGMTAARRGHSRIVVSAVERDAVVNAANFAAPHAVDAVGVDRLGHIDLAALRAALSTKSAAILAVQHANQEVGTVQWLDSIADAADAAGVPLLVDATSSIGHIDPPERWDALVAHPADWGGPAGIAVIALQPHTRWLPAWPEGDDWAPGGFAVPLALASAVALQERNEARATESPRLHSLVARLREGVQAFEGIDVQGDPTERLPHVLTFSCLYADGEALVTELDKEGFAVGSGSACMTGTLEPSRVLAAVGALTHGNIRLALHPGVTADHVERFLAALPGVLARVRGRLGSR